MKFPALEWISIDGKLIFAARIIRTFAYGFLSIIFIKFMSIDNSTNTYLYMTSYKNMIFNIYFDT